MGTSPPRDLRLFVEGDLSTAWGLEARHLLLGGLGMTDRGMQGLRAETVLGNV